MPKVNFNLSPNSNKDSTIQFIRLVFRYGTPSKRFIYNVGEGIEPISWDYKKQRAKVTRATPQYESLNTSLNNLEHEVLKIYNTYEMNGETLTTDQFKKELDIAIGKTERQFKATSFFDFVKDFIQSRKENADYAPRTVIKYNQTLKHLETFAKLKKRKIDFDTIDLEFFDEFIKYLYSKNYAQNNVEKHINTLKVFLNDATERRFNSNMAFKSKKFSISKEDVNNIYLSENEIETFYNLDLSNNNRLERVRDLFIIGCYTGLRFSDLSVLNSDNLTTIDGLDFINLKTQKTGVNVVIPLHPLVKSILAKYNGIPPRALSNQKMNDYLKEIAEMAELNERTVLSKTKGGRRCDVAHEKWELVTTHTARRSFATNAFKRGIPSISIMRITGHTTERAFMKYIKIDNEENAILMYGNDFFKGINEPHQLKKVS
jgi:integrase